MYAAYIGQVYERHNEGEFDFWVLYLSHETDSEAESYFDSRHKVIDTKLREQNVNSSEITTFAGRKGVYKKFALKNPKHPIFLVFNKVPRDVVDGEHFLIFKWRKRTDSESLKRDVMALVNFFSDEDFRNRLAASKDVTMRKRVSTFLEENGLALVGLGFAAAGA